ncbi:helicase associated domain-containing protein [Streptomyces sp. NBC_00829]|uniref:helicase associated domain-containing protein n=1 Tax=Streptomyces sp. NBC_00829 TaxID=2903679 RepID=UPI003868D0E2
MDATHQGYRVGIWLKNQRAAARKVQKFEQRRAEGLPVESSAGALPEDRREQLEEIDPSWCPTWPVEWQRAAASRSVRWAGCPVRSGWTAARNSCARRSPRRWARSPSPRPTCPPARSVQTLPPWSAGKR